MKSRNDKDSKVAFCTFFVEKQKEQQQQQKQIDSRQNTFKTVPTASGKYF